MDNKIFFIKTKESATIPARAYETDAGMDLFSAEDATIYLNSSKLISTGLKIWIYPNKIFKDADGNDFVWQAEVRPRSGLAAKHSISVINSPGTIDTSYQGDLKVILFNHGKKPYSIKAGDRIAQLLITKSYVLPIEEVQEFSEITTRAEGGFGSTGKS